MITSKWNNTRNILLNLCESVPNIVKTKWRRLKRSRCSLSNSLPSLSIGWRTFFRLDYFETLLVGHSTMKDVRWHQPQSAYRCLTINRSRSEIVDDHWRLLANDGAHCYSAVDVGGLWQWWVWHFYLDKHAVWTKPLLFPMLLCKPVAFARLASFNNKF